jgi:hypothetical protein
VQNVWRSALRQKTNENRRMGVTTIDLFEKLSNIANSKLESVLNESYVRTKKQLGMDELRAVLFSTKSIQHL